ncbi:MAG: hypothetical protein R3297_03735, partial [Desulfobulbales bacterium]|nr:hypothetical protein [Desulfobulbales bacterium]
GVVCYFESYDPVDDFDYCLDYTQDPPTNVCSIQADLCCTDPGDGTYSDCGLLADDAYGADLTGPDGIPDGINDTCIVGSLVTVNCRQYEDKWVFNIADFVGMLWGIGNNNAYNIKLRFYPLPLNQGE